MQLRKNVFFCSPCLPFHAAGYVDRGLGGLVGWQISSITGAGVCAIENLVQVRKNIVF